MPSFTTYVPRHRVIIKDLKTGQIKFDVSNDLVSLGTNKAYGRAAGTFQILLTAKVFGKLNLGYEKRIQPNDLVTIELDAGAGDGLKPVMIGLVDRVSKTSNTAGNNPQRGVKISGRDLGKLLVTHDIGWDISGAQTQNTIQKQGEGAGVKKLDANYLSRFTLQTGTATSLIMQIFGIFLKALNSSAQAKFIFTSTTDDEWEIWDSSLQTIQDASAWAAMERHSHRPWNMLHCDTFDLNTFQITLERNPINDQGMLDRPESATHFIDDNGIVMEDVGCSDGERVNLLCYWPTAYHVTPESTVDIVMAHPDLTKFDEAQIELNGYCPYTIKDNFSPPAVRTAIDEDGYGILVAEAIPRAEIFWNWYSMNHELESGTFLIHGDPAIKAGDVLLVRQGTTSTKKEYLIEQVVHSYSVWPRIAFTTTMQVTRGQAHA